VVLALQRSRSGEDPVYNPGPETKLSSGDVMIVLGREDQVHQLREYAEGRGPPHSFFWAGEVK